MHRVSYVSSDITTCLACINQQAVRQAITLYYDAFTSNDPASEVGKCQYAIGKQDECVPRREVEGARQVPRQPA
jgi:diphthamide biosynthesis methyltransferase